MFNLNVIIKPEKHLECIETFAFDSLTFVVATTYLKFAVATAFVVADNARPTSVLHQIFAEVSRVLPAYLLSLVCHVPG